MADSTTIERDALAGRLFAAMLGAMDLVAIHLGDRLGCYRLLAESGPAPTSAISANGWSSRRSPASSPPMAGRPGASGARPAAPRCSPIRTISPR